MNKAKALLLSITGLFGILTWPGPAAASEVKLDMTPATVRFGYITGIPFPTFIIAEDMGFFAKQNITIEKTMMNGSGPVTEALAAGNVDMGNTTPISAVLAAAKGARVTMVSGYEYTFTDKAGVPWEATFMVVRGGEGIKDYKDLRGKRVAVNSLGSAYNYLLRERLKEHGLDPEKDVTILPVPFGQMAGALVQKQVDAIIGVANDLKNASDRMPVEVIATHSSMEGLDVGLTSAIGVYNDYLKKNPDVVVRFLRAFLEARQWMAKAVAENDPKLQQVVAAAMKMTPERSKFFHETRGGYYGKELFAVNLLDIPQRLIRHQVKVLKAVDLLPADKQVTYQQVVDIAPLQRAYQSLGLTWDPSKH